MVSNLINSNNRTVANQFIISELGSISFQSYNSLVCKIENGRVTLGRDYDYSRTTMKHLLTFLRDAGHRVNSIADVRKRIKDGEWLYDETMR